MIARIGSIVYLTAESVDDFQIIEAIIEDIFFKQRSDEYGYEYPTVKLRLKDQIRDGYYINESYSIDESICVISDEFYAHSTRGAAEKSANEALKYL